MSLHMRQRLMYLIVIIHNQSFERSFIDLLSFFGNLLSHKNMYHYGKNNSSVEEVPNHSSMAGMLLSTFNGIGQMEEGVVVRRCPEMTKARARLDLLPSSSSSRNLTVFIQAGRLSTLRGLTEGGGAEGLADMFVNDIGGKMIDGVGGVGP